MLKRKVSDIFVSYSYLKTFFDMATQETRKAKLQQKYRSLSYGSKFVPELRLSGVWLEELGFIGGQKLDVNISRGKLVITVYLSILYKL